MDNCKPFAVECKYSAEKKAGEKMSFFPVQRQGSGKLLFLKIKASKFIPLYI
jgi:hypothetical protein